MNAFFRRRFTPTLLFEADKDKGGGTVEAKLPDDVLEGFRNLLSKEGGGKDAAATLFLENKSLRDDRRELQEKLEAYQEISEDPETLKKKFSAYKELGDDPESLKEELENGREAIQKNNTYERQQANAKVAEALNWNPKVLNRLSDDDAEYEVKTRKNDEGEDVKYAVIKTDEGEKDLSEYANENWDDMMPALKANNESNEEKSSGKSFASQKPSGGGKKNEKSYLKSAIAKNHKEAGLSSDEDDD